MSSATAQTPRSSPAQAQRRRDECYTFLQVKTRIWHMYEETTNGLLSVAVHYLENNPTFYGLDADSFEQIPRSQGGSFTEGPKGDYGLQKTWRVSPKYWNRARFQEFMCIN